MDNIKKILLGMGSIIAVAFVLVKINIINIEGDVNLSCCKAPPPEKPEEIKCPSNPLGSNGLKIQKTQIKATIEIDCKNQPSQYHCEQIAKTQAINNLSEQVAITTAHSQRVEQQQLIYDITCYQSAAIITNFQVLDKKYRNNKYIYHVQGTVTIP